MTENLTAAVIPCCDDRAKNCRCRALSSPTIASRACKPAGLFRFGWFLISRGEVELVSKLVVCRNPELAAPRRFGCPTAEVGRDDPEVLATETRRYPAIGRMSAIPCGPAGVVSISIQLYCRDGLNEAYYDRPERLLDAAARVACAAWSFVSPATITAHLDHLRRDIGDGTWHARYGHLRTQP
jgi:hypothetical protein